MAIVVHRFVSECTCFRLTNETQNSLNFYLLTSHLRSYGRLLLRLTLYLGDIREIAGLGSESTVVTTDMCKINLSGCRPCRFAARESLLLQNK